METRAQRSQFGQGPHHQEAVELGLALGLLIPTPRFLSLVLGKGTNSSRRRGMRMLGIALPEGRSTPWKNLPEAALRELSRVLWEAWEDTRVRKSEN